VNEPENEGSSMGNGSYLRWYLILKITRADVAGKLE